MHHPRGAAVERLRHQHAGGDILGQVLHEGHETGGVVFHESPASSQDYVSTTAVVRLLPAIATTGRQRIYNVAAGGNTSHAAIAYCLRDIAGWHTRFAPDAPTVRHRPIDTARLDAEFGPTASNLVADLPILLALAQEHPYAPSTKPMAA